MFYVLPDEAYQPELYKLVITYQLYGHSKTFHRYKNQSCQFQFERSFWKRTIVVETLASNISQNDKLGILEKQRQVLIKVKDYINSCLNPIYVYLFDHFKVNFVEVKSVFYVLNESGIDEFEYERTLGIPADNGFQHHWKVPTNSCFLNNYFDIRLLAWKVNMGT